MTTLRCRTLATDAIIAIMAQLIVRNIDQKLVRALKRRAARHGVSMEAEHREILREVLLGGGNVAHFKHALASMPDIGTDEDFVFERDPDRGDGILG